MTPKYYREGNLVYTLNRDNGTNEVMISVTTQPRDMDREIDIAEYVLELLKRDCHEEAEK